MSRLPRWPPPFSSAAPWLAAPAERSASPAGTTFAHNLGFNDPKWINASAANDLQNQDPLFVNEAFLNSPADVSKTRLARPGANPTRLSAIAAAGRPRRRRQL